MYSRRRGKAHFGNDRRFFVKGELFPVSIKVLRMQEGIGVELVAHLPVFYLRECRGKGIPCLLIKGNPFAVLRPFGSVTVGCGGSVGHAVLFRPEPVVAHADDLRNALCRELAYPFLLLIYLFLTGLKILCEQVCRVHPVSHAVNIHDAHQVDKAVHIQPARFRTGHGKAYSVELRVAGSRGENIPAVRRFTGRR